MHPGIIPSTSQLTLDKIKSTKLPKQLSNLAKSTKLPKCMRYIFSSVTDAKVVEYVLSVRTLSAKCLKPF